MRALLRKLFGRPAVVDKAPPAQRPPLTIAKAGPQRPLAPAAEGPLAFARFAEALRLVPPSTSNVFSPRDLEEEDATVKLLLARVEKDHHGPESFPALSMRVLQIIADGDPEVRELAQLVSRDPALCATVLRVANSPIYRGLGTSQTMRDAIARLGTREVARVAGAVSARSLFHPKSRSERASVAPLLVELHEHATATAAGAAWLAMQKAPARSDRAWLGGLLHDVGKSLALRALGSLSAEGKAAPVARDLRTARLLHRVHGSLGAELATRWSLPVYVAQICGQHHDAELPLSPELTDLHVVRLVSSLRLLRAAPDLNACAASELPQSAHALQIDPRQLRAMEGDLQALAIKGRAVAR